MTFALRDGVHVADTDNGLALLDEHSGEYWNLNPSGALVLRTLLKSGNPERAARELSEEYDVDIPTAGEDVRALVRDLCTAGLAQQ